MHRLLTAIIIILQMITLAHASDLEREKRLKDQIVDAILDGDVEMLSIEGHQFLSIHTQAESARGAVLILHGRGFHPDWIDVVNPLRTGLIEHGWSTLSIQLPVLEKSAKYYDYLNVFDEAIPRIDVAIDFLMEQGYARIILLAHSCGAHMAMRYIREKGEGRFNALIGIGMGATDYQQPMLESFPLNTMRKPILDVYAENDYPAVHRLAGIRAQQMQNEGSPLSKQLVVEGANHYFTGMGAPLVDAIGDWLDKLP